MSLEDLQRELRELEERFNQLMREYNDVLAERDYLIQEVTKRWTAPLSYAGAKPVEK